MSETKTILIVEDNPLNMKLFVDLLELNHFCVLKATDGLEALEILKDHTPGLILMDIHLPGMDGVDLLERFRKKKELATTKVVAISASVTGASLQRVQEASFDDFIAKPIDIKQFIQTVRKLLPE